MLLWLPILGLIISFIVVYLTKATIPLSYTPYLSVAILASLDSLMGGIRAGLERKFEDLIFLSGFFINALAAAFFAYLGDLLGVPLYLAAVVAFGVRIFQNISLIRRLLLESYSSRRDKPEGMG